MIGALNDSEIDHLLRTETIGRLGCCADGQIYLVPVMFVAWLCLRAGRTP